LYNPFDPVLRVDPYPVYHHIRATDPIHRSPLGFWALSRYADVVVVQRNGNLSYFSQEAMKRLETAVSDLDGAASKVARWMVFTDRGRHRRFRGLLGHYFTSRAVDGTRSIIERSVRELLDRLPEDRPVNLIEEFARLLPINMFCDWLGVPVSDREMVRSWAQSIGRILITVLNPEMMRQMAGAVLAADEYFTAKVADRRRNPRDDLLTALLRAEYNGEPISDEEVVSNVTLLIGALNETTVNLIGNGVLALLQHPDQLALLRADRSLIVNAVEELLRYDSPSQLQGRYTLEPLRIGDVEIPAGQRITLMLGAANRDPERFPDPDRLDITRPNVRPTSFGAGAHHCIGAWLARLETQVAISMLLDMFPTIEGPVDGVVHWRSEPVAVRALNRLDLWVSRR